MGLFSQMLRLENNGSDAAGREVWGYGSAVEVMLQ